MRPAPAYHHHHILRRLMVDSNGVKKLNAARGNEARLPGDQACCPMR